MQINNRQLEDPHGILDYLTNTKGLSTLDALNALIVMGDEIAACRDVQVGEIVQLDPVKTGNKAFAGCFMVVDEVKGWGVQGYVQPLGEKRDEPPQGVAYYRAEKGTFDRTYGRAPWVKQ